MSRVARSYDKLSYVGEVTFSTKMNNRTYQIKKFNHGTKYLSDLFTSAILGFDKGDEKDSDAVLSPTSIQFCRFDDGNSDNLSSANFLMDIPQVLTGRTYITSTDKETEGWKFPKFNAIVYKNNFTNRTGTGNIFACLVDKHSHIIAVVDTGTSDIEGEGSLFGSSNNLIITWTMKLSNATDSNTNVTDVSAYPTNEQEEQQENNG